MNTDKIIKIGQDMPRKIAIIDYIENSVIIRSIPPELDDDGSDEFHSWLETLVTSINSCDWSIINKIDIDN